MPLLEHQYIPFLETALLILCYNTQASAIKQLLNYKETSSCVGAHYYVTESDLWWQPY